MQGRAVEQTEEFFVTGLEKYLDAKSAVTMFEQEVQRRVKKVVMRRQPELAVFFGNNLPLKDYYDISGMPEYMFLSQRAAFKGSGVLYFSLAFERDEEDRPSLLPHVRFWRERDTLLNSLWDSVEAIQPRPENLGVRTDRFWLAGTRPSNNWESCEKELDSVITDWIELWKSHCPGGLPKLP
jgi:hypothetical protein